MLEALAQVDVAPWVGVVGVAVGAWLARGNGVLSGRREFNVAMLGRRMDHMGEAIRCAESLLVVLGNLLIGMQKQKQAALDQLPPGGAGTFHYVPDTELIARHTKATAEWRALLARRNLDGTEETARALIYFDEMRAAAIEDFHACNVEGDAQERLDAALRGVHLSCGVVAARINCVTAADYFSGLERVRMRSLAKKELKEAQKRFDAWADATIPKPEASTG